MYYLALLGALVVPDICGALESENGEADSAKYRRWFRLNVSPLGYTSEAPGIRSDNPLYDADPGTQNYDFLSPDDAWWFRCSFLHQGSTQHPDGQYSRIAFVEPGYLDDMSHVHLNIEDDVLQIDVERFCGDLVGAARSWFVAKGDTPNVSRNLDRFVRRYPEGLLSLLPGVPVIS